MHSRLLFLPGAQKAGTSTLHGLLTSHPNISPLEFGNDRVKEPHFFALTPARVEKHFEWYCSLLGTSETAYSIDSSTSYLMAPAMPRMTRHYFPDSKAIVILRDPVQRAFSGYMHMRKKLPAREKRAFSTIVDALHDRREKTGILKKENDLVDKAAQKGQIDASYFDESYLPRRIGTPFHAVFQDPLWPYKYFQYSCYSERLRDLHEAFGSDLKVVCLERLSSETDEVAEEIFRFLDVQNTYDDPGHQNQTAIPTRFGRMYSRAKQRLDQSILSPLIQRLAESPWMRRVKTAIKSRVWRDKNSIHEETSAVTMEKARQLLDTEYGHWGDPFTKYWS